MIESVLKPMQGIEKLRINVPLKRVLVDHDVDRITADEIAKSLHSFGATVLRDGGDGVALPKSLVGRSQLYVQNICCASEIPAINSIIGKLPGVKHISINTTTKLVYIDHVPTTISANDLCKALNKEHFGAEVRVDAAASLAAANSHSSFVQSTLILQNDVIESDIEDLSTLLQSFVDSSKMEKFVVDIPAKNIVVVHNPFCLTAPQIAALVTESTTMNATVLIDGADPSRWKYPETLREKKSESDHIDGMEKDEKMTCPRVTVIISGVLWVISMLSLIGGKWYVGLYSLYDIGIPQNLTLM
jgi:copper chaperone CopZ